MWEFNIKYITVNKRIEIKDYLQNSGVRRAKRSWFNYKSSWIMFVSDMLVIKANSFPWGYPKCSSHSWLRIAIIIHLSFTDNTTRNKGKVCVLTMVLRSIYVKFYSNQLLFFHWTFISGNTSKFGSLNCYHKP